MSFGTEFIDYRYTIFASQTHAYRLIGLNKVVLDRRWWTVIPPLSDPDKFTYSEEKLVDTFLYLGRIQKIKGVEDFLHMSNLRPCYKFIIAGDGTIDEKGALTILDSNNQYDLPKDYPNVTYVGFVKEKERAKLLSSCSALIQPTHGYYEPFGQNVIEAYLSGMPVIVADQGAFVETVVEGQTGYRCVTWDDYVNAMDNIRIGGQITPENCRKEGLKYTGDVLYPKFQDFLERVTILAQLNTI